MAPHPSMLPACLTLNMLLFQTDLLLSTLYKKELIKLISLVSCITLNLEAAALAQKLSASTW